ncbi:MAG: TlpA family protein disulfide reductase [Zoogloeaceae bacterium]|jgi:thiol-disulfide isomerase/thioredoxin|nr:TlpA family protein disulfide reductase [Zoogloeaceae bacterium]
MRRQIGNRWLPVCALLLPLALLALVLPWPGTREEPAPSSILSAEDAALQQLLQRKLVDVNQKVIDLAAWRGRIQVINFWATWCAPCKEEMPAFSHLQEAFPEVRFVGIAVDSVDNVRAFSAKHPVSYPLPLGDDTLLRLSRELGNSYMSLPFTLVVSQEGKLLAQKSGRFAKDDLAALLRQLTANALPVSPSGNQDQDGARN